MLGQWARARRPPGTGILRRAIFPLFVVVVALLPAAAGAACTGNTIVGCPAAVSPGSSDLLLGWQPGQNPHTRIFSLPQVLGAGLPASVSTLSASGVVTLNGSGTGLSVANNEAITGTSTIGPASGNKLTVTGGAASTNAIALSQSGTGGFTVQGAMALPASGGLQATTWLNVGNGKNLANSGALAPIFQTSIGTISGTVTGSGNPAWNVFSNGFDTADAHAVSSGLTLARVAYAYGGAGMSGDRSALTVQSTQTATSSNAGLGHNPFYGAGNFWVTMNATEGGTAPTLTGGSGQAFALNPQVLLATGATNFLEMTGGEVNLACQGSCSVARKFDWKITPLGTDANQGNIADAMLKFGGASGAVARKNGILFGGDISQWEVTGTLIKTEYSNAQLTRGSSSTWGADWLEESFSNFGTGGIIRAQGFEVSGDDQLQLGKALFVPSASALSIDVSGQLGTAASLNAAGTSCAVGDILDFGANGRAVVNTVTGSAVATYTVLNAPYDFSGSPPATLSATAYPASAGPCTGVVFNMTWAGATTINVGTSAATIVNLGGAQANVQMGSGAALATNATIGFPLIPSSAGAPTGNVSGAGAGKVAIEIDTTNKKLCYTTGGGTWECSAAFTP